MYVGLMTKWLEYFMKQLRLEQNYIFNLLYYNSHGRLLMDVVVHKDSTFHSQWIWALKSANLMEFVFLND